MTNKNNKINLILLDNGYDAKELIKTNNHLTDNSGNYV
jgi:hypothetical protein